jgi:hypothetical protein
MGNMRLANEFFNIDATSGLEVRNLNISKLTANSLPLVAVLASSLTYWESC